MMDGSPHYFEQSKSNCKSVCYMLENWYQLSAALASNRCLGSAWSRRLTRAPRQKLFSMAAVPRSAFIVAAAAVFAI